MSKSIVNIRKQELYRILACYFLKAWSNTFALSVPLLYIMIATLSVYVSIGGEFTSSKVFGILALTSALRLLALSVLRTLRVRTRAFGPR